MKKKKPESALHARLRKEYTKVSKGDGGYVTYLKVDQQSFSVHMGPTTRARARWIADMLVNALTKLLVNEEAKKLT